MAAAGVALAFGSDTPGDAVRPVGRRPGRGLAPHARPSGSPSRAAFDAHTRGGWRAARRDEGGVIAVGAPASIAVWDVPGDLVVQTPDARVAAWSTDPRAGVPQLPDLHPDVDLPTCVLTLRRRATIAYEATGAPGMSDRSTRAAGKLDLDPVAVRKARSPGPPGRPADREPGQAAHDGLRRAGHAAAGRARRAPTPTASRG